MQWAHRDRIGATKMDSKLSSEILERIKAMARIESLLIFAMTALDFAIVARRVRADELMADLHLSKSGLKQSWFVAFCAAEAICEL